MNMSNTAKTTKVVIDGDLVVNGTITCTPKVEFTGQHSYVSEPNVTYTFDAPNASWAITPPNTCNPPYTSGYMQPEVPMDQPMVATTGQSVRVEFNKDDTRRLVIEHSNRRKMELCEGLPIPISPKRKKGYIVYLGDAFGSRGVRFNDENGAREYCHTVRIKFPSITTFYRTDSIYEDMLPVEESVWKITFDDGTSRFLRSFNELYYAVCNGGDYIKKLPRCCQIVVITSCTDGKPQRTATKIDYYLAITGRIEAFPSVDITLDELSKELSL